MALNFALFRKTHLAAVFFLSLLLASAPFFAQAAGSGSYSAAPSKPAGYDAAVKLIKERQFAKAIPVLHDIEKTAKDDADVQNLLGFAYRKTGQLDMAGFHYKQALRLDPKHKGALEYQGELFLMLKDKVSAEANYERLKKICWLGCDELDDLEDALKSYKG